VTEICAYTIYGLRFRPEGLTRRMHRPEKLISVTEICAYTIYNRRAFEFRKSRSGLERMLRRFCCG